MGWKESKRAQGFKDMLVWLEPAAVAALEQLKAASPGSSVAEIVSRAVILAAGMDLPETAGPAATPGTAVVPDADDLVAEMLERVTALSARVDRLESNVVQDGQAPKVRVKRGRYDQDMLLNAIADRFERDGKEANLSELYRELDSQGVPVHSQFSNFWNMYNSRRADVEAILQQRKAARDAGGES